MVLQSWVIDGFKMYKISDKIINVIEETMKNRRVKFTAERKTYLSYKSKEAYSRICNITIIICNRNDSSQQYTSKISGWTQTS